MMFNFLPGQTFPPHKHPGVNVQLLVIEGEGTFTVDGEAMVAIKGDVLFLSSEEEFGFVNTGAEKCSLFVLLNRIASE